MTLGLLLLSLRRQIRRSLRLARALGRIRFRLKCSWLWIWRKLIPAGLAFGPPKGAFSIYEGIQSGAIPGRVVVVDQPPPKVPPRSLRRIAGLQQHLPMAYPIFWSRHSHARLVGPTLLLMNDRKRVAIESAWGRYFLPGDPGYHQFRRPAPIYLSGNWTSLVSYWSQGFCHWIIDTLPRCALLNEFPQDTRVLVPARLQAYQRETLQWLGLEERIRPTSEQHIVLENYYFTAPTGMSGAFAPYAVDYLRRTFLTRRDLTFQPRKKIYIRRVNAGRGMVNDADVTALFERLGWGIYDTEQLTMAQQIQLFAEADVVCALHGAALTNLVWCQPGTRVVEIVASTFMNGVYEGISEAAGLDYHFLLCPGDAHFRARVDLRQLEPLLG